MKQSDVILTEYVKRLSDDDLSWLRIRSKQDVCGDKADIANFLSKDKDVDRWLLTAATADDLFDMLELVGNHIQQEYNRRNEVRGKK
jgi:hypothetical protein